MEKIDTEYALFVKEIANSETTRYPKDARRFARDIHTEIQAFSQEAPREQNFLGGIKGQLTNRVSQNPASSNDNFDQAATIKNIPSPSSCSSNNLILNSARRVEASRGRSSLGFFARVFI